MNKPKHARCWPCEHYTKEGCEIGKNKSPMDCSDFVREPGHDMREAVDEGLIDGSEA